MIEAIPTKLFHRGRVYLGGVGVILCALCIVVPGNEGMGPENAATSAAKSAVMREAIAKEVSRRATMNFQPSLEMRENVDFLLTPALLVQEALSEDVVITYPGE
jgi:hypothetical protein